MSQLVEIEWPKHWRWRGLLVSRRLEEMVEWQYLFRHTHGAAIYIPSMAATIYWVKPLHFPVRWAHRLYCAWLRLFIFPLARYVLGEGEAIWKPLRWPLEAMESYGQPPTVRLIRDA